MRPQNNWRAAFGGSAWTCDEPSGRWYLHSFYPEQPDLDWRNPEVVAAMQDVVRTWLGRGVDGFRLDALDCLGKHPDLLDDPPATAPPPFPEPEEVAALERLHSRNWIPDGAPGTRGPARGGRRRVPGGRGVPADGRARAVPRVAHVRVRVRAALLGLAG